MIFERKDNVMIDNMQAIYHLGEIDWFGGYNSKINDYNNFGFLKGGIYFKKAALNSPWADKYVYNRVQKESVLFVLRDETDIKKGAVFVRIISEIPDDELIQLYSQNNSVKEIFSNLSNVFGLSSDASFQSLLRYILKNEGTYDVLNFIHANPNCVSSNLLDAVPWQEIQEDDKLSFFLYCRGNDVKEAEILKDLFPRWIDNDRIIERLKMSYFPACISKGLESNDNLALSKLLERISNQGVKAKMASLLPFEHFASNKDYCDAMDDEFKATVLMTHFENNRDIDLKSLGILLSTIDPSNQPKSTIALGETLYALNIPLNIWECLSSVVKVWFILFLSFQLSNRDRWIDSLRNIYVYEHQRSVRDYSVIAAIKFLSIFLVDESRKQVTFEEAHLYLERAISSDFEKMGGPSKGITQLICRCKKDLSTNGSLESSNMHALCLARYWQNKGTMWCSAFHTSCGMFEGDDGTGVDYQKTRYVYRKSKGFDDAICAISLADLLHNIQFVPSLETVYSPAFGYRWGFEEYPYRITGRVHQLCKLFSHMHCRCKKIMKSNYAYSVKVDARISITHAYCLDASSEGAELLHDTDVYLNECWNCGEVIDSRECHFKQDKNGEFYSVDRSDISGFYVCKKCGAGLQSVKPSICPKCGCSDISLLRFNGSDEKKYFKECKKCGYNSDRWKSKFE